MSSNPTVITTGLLFISPTLLDAACRDSELSRHIRSCVRRHRAGDHGLAAETIKLQNLTARDSHGTVTSSFPLDLDAFIGDGDQDTLWIKTLPGWEETFIMLPEDLDREEELVMCEPIAD